MQIQSPFHEGELRVQQRAGEAERANKPGHAISDTIIPGAIGFIGQQQMAVIGSIDPQQNVWASVLFGEAGFMDAGERHPVPRCRYPLAGRGKQGRPPGL